MITIPNGLGGVTPVYTPAAYTGVQNDGGRAKEAEGVFDRASFTQGLSGESLFQRELVSRLVQEVRSSKTTSSIQKLQEDIHLGRYQADPAGIAARMLLEGFDIGNT